MSEDLKLSLNRGGSRRDRHGALWRLLLVLVVIISAATLLVVWRRTGGGRDSGSLSAAQLEELALKFEKQRVSGAAARTWIEYLRAARPGDGEAARIWYRVGKIYQESGDFERALEAYYRSEAARRVEELEGEIARRTAECLEGLGKFAALRSELETRTAVAESDTTGGAVILAEIGAWKISRTDLDRMIEEEIEAQIEQMATGLTEEQKRVQRERLLDSVLKEGQLGAWLERFIAEELLYREAREEKLHEDPRVNRLIRKLERQLLAQTLLAQEYEAQITIMPEELERYYEEHLEDFTVDGEQQPFDAVRDQVYAAVRMQREMDINRKVFEELKDRYDVVIHRSRLQ